jgi:hypothetical protein
MKCMEHIMCRLKKFINELKLTSRQRYLEFDEVIKKFSFTKDQMDNCIYIKKFGFTKKFINEYAHHPDIVCG